MSGAAYLFVDVDGYCAGGVDQRGVVSRAADGYRARELGWAYYADCGGATGSLYFRDRDVPPLAGGDPSVAYACRLHGLPVAPDEAAYRAPDVLDAEIVMCSSKLLEAFRLLHDAVAQATGLPVVFAHKGGNEGLWIGQAVPGATVLELGSLGCPRVDDIGKAHPELHLGQQCAFHAPAKRRARKVVHCPRLEVGLLAWWVACRYSAPGGPGGALAASAGPGLGGAPSKKRRRAKKKGGSQLQSQARVLGAPQ